MKRKLEVSAAIQTERFISFYKKSVINRRQGEKENEPYLIRWILFSCPWFSIKVHKILVSDEDCLHDHPWSFLSIILSGGYFEETPDWEEWVERAVVHFPGGPSTEMVANISRKKKWYSPGSILWRPAKMSVHRLELPKPAVTLVVTFRRLREWGFFTKEGWIPWFKYSPQNKCE